MSVINSSKTQLILELKKQFPRLQIVWDIADVLLVGKTLNAIDEYHKQKKWAYIRKGAKDSAFNAAYKKYGLLEKKEKERKVYLEYKRPHSDRLDSDTAILKALALERKGLYSHMLSDLRVRDVIVNALSLSTKNLDVIKRTFEKGTMSNQLKMYRKVIYALTSAGLYDKRHNYYTLGFRNVPHNYWLSKLALKLLSNAKSTT